MAIQPTAAAQPLSEVPADFRRRIVAGIRWTFWLSALGAPFSCGTTFLLARTSPEAIGTWGLLLVYIGLVSSFLYLGGDAVTVKFLPEITAAERVSFLASYFLVICAFLVPWLLAAALWPGSLAYVFGRQGAFSIRGLILWLSPLYILFAMSVAALKGLLEFGWAQSLLRVQTFGIFLMCAGSYFGPRNLLATRPSGLIWGTFFSLISLSAAIGLHRIWRISRRAGGPARLHFFLPKGFWRFTLTLQGASAVGFFVQRLDHVLILNYGGLRMLGIYVALLGVALVIQIANSFFLDTLLPSLTNLIAARDMNAASDVFSSYMRLLFVVDTGATCGLIFLAGPITRLLGPHYIAYRNFLVWIVLLVGLAGPGAAGGTLLTAGARPQRTVMVSLVQIGAFTLLFVSLWPTMGLLGALLAHGVSLLASNALLLEVARRSVPVRFRAGADYAKSALVAGLAASLAVGPLPLGVGGMVVGWAATIGLFLWLARYRVADCLELVNCFIPTRSSPAERRSQT